MALKKSQLYSSLWQSCYELRGGMDASQYKDYVRLVFSEANFSPGNQEMPEVFALGDKQVVACPPLHIFISSVQKEFTREREALRDYLRGDPLMRRFFEVFLFEDAPASNRRRDDLYLEEIERWSGLPFQQSLQPNPDS